MAFNTPGSRGLARQIRQRLAAYFTAININGNVSRALPATPTATLLQAVGKDGTSPIMLLDGFLGNPTFMFRLARGTAAAPTAAQSGDQLGLFTARGYGTTGYSGSARLGFAMAASENWTDTSQGGELQFYTTPNGSSSIAKQAVIANDGGLVMGAPTGGSKGAGTVNATQVYVNGVAVAGGGSGSGLYSGQISATVPTSVNTGLSTWVHQNTATVGDSSNGILLSLANTGASSSYSIRSGLVTSVIPSSGATPYSVTALFAITVPDTGSGSFLVEGIFGWYDGTNKLQVLRVDCRQAAPQLYVSSNSTPTAFNATHGGAAEFGSPLVWLKILDDGTNVTFYYSADGVDFNTLYTVAKSSGYLGSSGYSNIIWGVSCNDTTSLSGNNTVRFKMLSWKTGTT